MYECRSKSSKPHLKGRVIAEHFCYGKTLLVLNFLRTVLVFTR